MIEFDWRTGVAATDWSSVAKKGQLDVRRLTSKCLPQFPNFSSSLHRIMNISAILLLSRQCKSSWRSCITQWYPFMMRCSIFERGKKLFIWPGNLLVAVQFTPYQAIPLFQDWTESWTSLLYVTVAIDEIKSCNFKHTHSALFSVFGREQEMQKLNRSTNSKMITFGYLSLLICMSVAGLQFWHLKTYFERKKLL